VANRFARLGSSKNGQKQNLLLEEEEGHGFSSTSRNCNSSPEVKPQAPPRQKQASRSRRCRQRFKQRLASSAAAKLSAVIRSEEKLDVEKVRSSAALDDHHIKERFGFVPDPSITSVDLKLLEMGMYLL
jgi:hypothetical protein